LGGRYHPTKFTLEGAPFHNAWLEIIIHLQENVGVGGLSSTSPKGSRTSRLNTPGSVASASRIV